MALLAFPLFLATGLPLEGWFWAALLWAVNRYLSVVIERRAAQAGPLRGVGMMGASMLLRPWIGMLALFLITSDNPTMAISSVLLLSGASHGRHRHPDRHPPHTTWETPRRC